MADDSNSGLGQADTASSNNELGYKVANAGAPPETPRKFEPLNPTFQEKADRALWELRQLAFK